MKIINSLTNRKKEDKKEIEIIENKQSINKMKKAFRQTYQDQKMKNILKLDKQGFLDAISIDGKMRYKLGVIDFLTKYDGIKFLENEFKSKLHQVDKM